MKTAAETKQRAHRRRRRQQEAKQQRARGRPPGWETLRLLLKPPRPVEVAQTRSVAAVRPVRRSLRPDHPVGERRPTSPTCP